MCIKNRCFEVKSWTWSRKKTMHKNSCSSKTQSKKQRDKGHDTERVWHWLWLQLLHRKKKNQYASWQDYPVLMLKQKCAALRAMRETPQACENLSCICRQSMWEAPFFISHIHFSPRVLAPPTWGASARGKKEQAVLQPISPDIDKFFIALHVPSRPPTRV